MAAASSPRRAGLRGRRASSISGIAAGATAARRASRATAAAGPLASSELSESSVPRSQIAEIQRSRLLAGAIRALEELGYAEVTVAQITRRARVSRRTFYELFPNREECLAAVLEEVVALVEGELEAANLGGLAWRERVRMGLWTILSFFDREPVLARVCVVHALRGGPTLLARREETLGRLVAVVDEGRRESGRPADFTSLTAEGLVGAAFAVLHTRLQRDERKPLRDLLGELTGLIVLPYQGAAAARKEQTRSAPEPVPGAARKFVKAPRAAVDVLDGVPMRLTYRTSRVLEGANRHPGASNRAIADYAGVADQGQVSKLLARLERLGLLANRGGRAQGDPNAWTLTPRGELIAQSIAAAAAPRTDAGARTNHISAGGSHAVVS